MKYKYILSKYNKEGETVITINSNESVYKIITKHPDIKAVMVELGFKDIVMPGMLQSIGRIMTIAKGCSIKHIEMKVAKEVFSKYDYNIIEK
jgi:phosphomannomutase